VRKLNEETQAVSPKVASSEQHPSVSISLRGEGVCVRSLCVCVCGVCGGGVLAGVEQSCNEQILERERERPEKQARTDDLVELGYNNNPDFQGERRDGEDKGRAIIHPVLLLVSRSERGSSSSRGGGRGDIHPPSLSRCSRTRVPELRLL